MRSRVISRRSSGRQVERASLDRLGRGLAPEEHRRDQWAGTFPGFKGALAGEPHASGRSAYTAALRRTLIIGIVAANSTTRAIAANLSHSRMRVRLI